MRGTLAAEQSSAGTVKLDVTNLHGDVVATIDDSSSAAGLNTYAETDEFGNGYDATSTESQYGLPRRLSTKQAIIWVVDSNGRSPVFEHDGALPFY